MSITFFVCVLFSFAFRKCALNSLSASLRQTLSVSLPVRPLSQIGRNFYNYCFIFAASQNLSVNLYLAFTCLWRRIPPSNFGEPTYTTCAVKERGPMPLRARAIRYRDGAKAIAEISIPRCILQQMICFWKYAKPLTLLADKSAARGIEWVILREGDRRREI